MKLKTRTAFSRILHYARETGIKFDRTNRRDLGKAYGIPNMRGFSPHLRTVSLGSGQKKDDPWIIHDLLHILFYDFASFYLGANTWLDETRFFETHLGSEAFAVLVLDYHLLSFEKQGGLAVDVRAGQWQEFQKLNPQLPSILSQEFCKILLDLYVSGNERTFKANRKTKAYETWLGHEIRYSEKQRYYVHLWWRDLNCSKKPANSILLLDSQVHFAVWELLELLLYKSNKEWLRWINIIKKFKPSYNYFAKLPKFQKPDKGCDFRLTNVQALEKTMIMEILSRAAKPNSSHLFLFWQILSLFPTDLHLREKRAIKRLALSSQSKNPDARSWTEVRKTVMGILEKQKQWKIRSESKANFFLS